MKKTLINTAFSLIGLYILAMISIYFIQDKYLYTGVYIEKQECIDRAKPWSPYEHTLDVDGAQISTWYIPKKDKPLIVFLGGTGMDAASYLPWLNSLENYSVATFNYRGVGKSTGKPKEKLLVNDTLDFIQFLEQKSQIESKDMILVGESLGAAIAIQAATHCEMKSIILIVPFFSFASIAQEKIPFFPMKALLKETLNSRQAANKINSPVTIFSAEMDTLIPYTQGMLLSKEFPTPASFHVIKGAHHTNVKNNDHFRSLFFTTLEK